MSDAAGYSSMSTIFLFKFSMMSLSASSGIQVCTKLSILSTRMFQQSGSDLRSEIQQWVSIECSFVVQQLVRGLRVDAYFRHGILGNIRRILIASPTVA